MLNRTRVRLCQGAEASKSFSASEAVKPSAPVERAWMSRGVLVAALVFLGCGLSAGRANAAAAGTPYSAPPTDVQVLRHVDFGRAQLIDPQLTALYQACDQNQERGGCYSDQAKNMVILRFPDNTVFFDAKMAIDADGSVLSKRGDPPHGRATCLRCPKPAAADGSTASVSDPYATGPGPSLDSERVPYVVMPLGDFRRESGVQLGDLAAVVKDGRVAFAIVGDLGPRTHIGEGSMKLHTELGHTMCTAYDADGNCSAFTDNSIDPPVLYFFFPDTKKLIYDGLNAGNVNERINTAGQQVWSAFLAKQKPEQGKN